MRRLVLAAILALLPLTARAQVEQQSLVDRATLSVEEMLTVPDPAERLATLRQARAVMICPRVFRAGLVIGGTGGGCVLVARDGAGSWSSPAFFHMGSGSLGLQIGVQDSEVMMMIMTEKGLAALMDTQFKIGGDASVAFATAGSGVDASSTRGFHKDIIAYSQTRGLFAGVALNGGMLTTDTDANHSFYGRDLAARQIVMQMQVTNPGADPLRAMLGKFGAPLTAQLDSPPIQEALDPPRAPPPARTRSASVTPVRALPLPPPPPPHR